MNLKNIFHLKDQFLKGPLIILQFVEKLEHSFHFYRILNHSIFQWKILKHSVFILIHSTILPKYSLQIFWNKQKRNEEILFFKIAFLRFLNLKFFVKTCSVWFLPIFWFCLKFKSKNDIFLFQNYWQWELKIEMQFQKITIFFRFSFFQKFKMNFTNKPIKNNFKKKLFKKYKKRKERKRE